MKKIIFASNNKGKLKEIKDILNDYEVLSLADVGVDVEVEEDQNTFYGNAEKKAKEIFALTKTTTIADDSGICIDELGDWPGVLTARFLGEDATQEQRNLAIIKRADETKTRNAKVVCNLVMFDGEHTVFGEGIIHGKIASCPKGENGFGFDKVFMLPSGKTLGELTQDEKNTLSARKLACVDLKNKLS